MAQLPFSSCALNAEIDTVLRTLDVMARIYLFLDCKANCLGDRNTVLNRAYDYLLRALCAARSSTCQAEYKIIAGQ
jgi:hypothetical protein